MGLITQIDRSMIFQLAPNQYADEIFMAIENTVHDPEYTTDGYRIISAFEDHSQPLIDEGFVTAPVLNKPLDHKR
jgi:hypothetical protein